MERCSLCSIMIMPDFWSFLGIVYASMLTCLGIGTRILAVGMFAARGHGKSVMELWLNWLVSELRPKVGLLVRWGCNGWSGQFSSSVLFAGNRDFVSRSRRPCQDAILVHTLFLAHISLPMMYKSSK